MAENVVTLSVSLETLLQAISTLSLEDKYTVLEALEQQIAKAEESWEQSTEIVHKIQESRDAYQAGDYSTIEDFINQLDVEE